MGELCVCTLSLQIILLSLQNQKHTKRDIIDSQFERIKTCLRGQTLSMPAGLHWANLRGVHTVATVMPFCSLVSRTTSEGDWEGAEHDSLLPSTSRLRTQCDQLPQAPATITSLTQWTINTLELLL